MFNVLLILQLLLVIGLATIILMQRSANDSLSGLSGGGHGVVSNKTSGNILTKGTMILALAFMINSIALARIVVNETKRSKTILESINISNELNEKDVPVAK